MEDETKKEEEDQYQELTICLILKYYLGCYCCCSTPVAPEPASRQRVQFVGEGFFIEDIFDQMIEKATVLDRDEKDKQKKLQSRFKFRAAGKMGRFGAVEAAKTDAARKKKFKSVAKITQLGAIASKNGDNTMSIEELPDEIPVENKKWNFKALGKLANVLGIAPPEEKNVKQAEKGMSFEAVGNVTQMGFDASKHVNDITPIDG